MMASTVLTMYSPPNQFYTTRWQRVEFLPKTPPLDRNFLRKCTCLNMGSGSTRDANSLRRGSYFFAEPSSLKLALEPNSVRFLRLRLLPPDILRNRTRSPYSSQDCTPAAPRHPPRTHSSGRYARTLDSRCIFHILLQAGTCLLALAGLSKPRHSPPLRN